MDTCLLLAGGGGSAFRGFPQGAVPAAPMSPPGLPEEEEEEEEPSADPHTVEASYSQNESRRHAFVWRSQCRPVETGLLS